MKFAVDTLGIRKYGGDRTRIGEDISSKLDDWLGKIVCDD